MLFVELESIIRQTIGKTLLIFPKNDLRIISAPVLMELHQQMQIHCNLASLFKPEIYTEQQAATW